MATYGNRATYLNTLSLSQMTDLVRREWVYYQYEIPKAARELFIYDYIGDGQGSSKRYNEIDVEMFSQRKYEGQDSQVASVSVGYEKDLISATYSMAAKISLELRVQNRYKEVGGLITQLSQFVPNGIELDLTHRFSFATSSSYVDRSGDTVDVTVGDGNPLLYATHTLSHSSTTYNNIVTGSPEFSQGSFEAAKILADTQTYTNLGQMLKTMNYDTIITGSDAPTIRTVKQMLNSTADISAIQAGVKNVYANMAKHVILPYLASTATGAYDSTKRRWWFYAAIGGGTMNRWQAYLGEWLAPTLRTPAAGNNGEDIMNLDWTYITFGMYGIACVSSRGLVGSTPTS